MPYEPIHTLDNVFVQTDYEAALKNYGNAAGRVKEARRFGTQADVDTALTAYQITRARLLDVRQYVTVAGGHPHLPESI
ncbi:hypothetical protein [Rhodococcus aetherivorans]|uniref:hypothetical protein n=1 Tax=Rhodococcus aetherivorans TaxID=191292 RepID=UPI00241CA15D|nr:hypothetical protein [Rhodococcus aetherivorans]WFS13799.1 hypothetical protein P9K37_01380 [Rhodococcus aetherivorans]